MLHLIPRYTILSKFGRVLGRISAETYLKMDYFGKPQKSPNAGGSTPDPCSG